MTQVQRPPSEGPGRHRRVGTRTAFGLELNAVALMGTTALTALVGLLFWGVAAQYPEAEVGRTSAILTTATSISALSSLAVGLLFSRFLGSTGRRSARFVLAGYGITTGIAVLLGGGFALWFAGGSIFVSPLERLAFPAVAVVLALFTLQDWVLIGLRGARWVPIGQCAFAVLKLGLLALFVAMAWRDGIVVAWAAPAAVSVLVISLVLFARVLPRRPPPAEGAVALPTRRRLGVLFLGEYATGATSVVAPLVLPLIVVAQLGTEANAHFTLPWIVSTAVTTLLWNISSSYMTEASNDLRQAAALMRRTLRLMCLVAAVAVPSLLLAAPLLLSVGRGNYAAEGTDLLRLMALAMPFTIVWDLYTSTARIRQQLGRVVVLQGIVAVTVVGLALLLAKPMGVTGIGVAYLGAEALAAVIVARPVYRMMRAGAAPPDRKTVAGGVPVGTSW